MFTVKRSEANPLISPDRSRSWESAATFNWCPVQDGKKTYVLYRAMSEPDPLHPINLQTSVVACAVSTDREHFSKKNPLIVPDTDFDRYGCEDPRVTKIGKNYYIFYTALSQYPFNADGIKVAVAVSKDLKKIDHKQLVTPFNAKAMALFPGKVNGKYAAILTVNTDVPHTPSTVAYAEFDKLDDIYNQDYWNEWYKDLSPNKIALERSASDQVEVGAPPLKTPKGWLLIYSHISNYHEGKPNFGIEAVLLDLKNPRKIIGRTKGSFLTPEKFYETIGVVPNIVFPSGALIVGDILEIYYGGADTHCAKASVSLQHLLEALLPNQPKHLKRFPGNPIITPRPGKVWEEGGTFNPASIYLNNKVHLLYRAVTSQNLSTIGYASSLDGFTITERSPDPIYKARKDFEGVGKSENAGCEDPRLVLINKRLYMTYTGYDGHTPRIVISDISTSDFLEKKWHKWSEPTVISEPGVPNKDAILIPEKINGHYYLFHRVGLNICLDIFPSLDFSKKSIESCLQILAPRKGMWDSHKVGMAGPPVKTPEGWLIFYHGISETKTYRVGAALLDLKNPTNILARTATPIFEPQENYELQGVVDKVVFPCGHVCIGDKIYLYYGAADWVIGVATAKISDIVNILTV